MRERKEGRELSERCIILATAERDGERKRGREGESCLSKDVSS